MFEGEDYEKACSDIQSNIALVGNVISGTSLKVADWDGAFDMSKGDHFIALHFEAGTGQTIKVECVPSQGSPSPEFNDDEAVFQITEDTTAIKATTYADGAVVDVDVFELDVELGE